MLFAQLWPVYIFASVFGIYTLLVIAQHYFHEFLRINAAEAQEPITPISELLREQYESTKKERIVL